MNGIKRRNDKEVRKRQNKNQYLVAGLRVPGDAGVAGLAGRWRPQLILLFPLAATTGGIKSHELAWDRAYILPADSLLLGEKGREQCNLMSC